MSPRSSKSGAWKPIKEEARRCDERASCIDSIGESRNQALPTSEILQEKRTIEQNGLMTQLELELGGAE